MSTNFYLERSENGMTTQEHIGKRSGGWAFSFQARNHNTAAAWRRRLDAMGNSERIVDEHGRPYTVDEFYQLTYETLQPWGPNKIMPKVKDGPDRRRNWVDGGFSFSNYEFC